MDRKPRERLLLSCKWKMANELRGTNKIIIKTRNTYLSSMPWSKSMRSSVNGLVVDTRRGTLRVDVDDSYDTDVLRSPAVSSLGTDCRALFKLFWREGNWNIIKNQIQIIHSYTSIHRALCAQFILPLVHALGPTRDWPQYCHRTRHSGRSIDCAEQAFVAIAAAERWNWQPSLRRHAWPSWFDWNAVADDEATMRALCWRMRYWPLETDWLQMNVEPIIAAWWAIVRTVRSRMAVVHID